MLNNSIYSVSAVKERLEEWLKNNKIKSDNDFTFIKGTSIGAPKIDTTRSMFSINKSSSWKQAYRPSSASKLSRNQNFVPWDEYFRTQICRALHIDEKKLSEVDFKKTVEVKQAVKSFKELSLYYK